MAIAKLLLEVGDGSPQSHSELDFWRPPERGSGVGNIWPAATRIVYRQRLVEDSRMAADEVGDDMRKFSDRRFYRIAEINRVERVIRTTASDYLSRRS
jgi:hypothetical protein